MGALMPDETERGPRKPLDPKKVEHAKPREKDYKLADTGGLYLFVSTSGHRTWPEVSLRRQGAPVASRRLSRRGLEARAVAARRREAGPAERTRSRTGADPRAALPQGRPREYFRAVRARVARNPGAAVEAGARRRRDHLHGAGPVPRDRRNPGRSDRREAAAPRLAQGRIGEKRREVERRRQEAGHPQQRRDVDDVGDDAGPHTWILDLDREPAAELVADKGYDSLALREWLVERGTQPVIPPRKNRKVQYDYDRAIHKQRNVVERMFCRFKDWCRIATRFDRNIKNFMAAIAIAAAVI